MEPRRLLSAVYYVSPTGNDLHAGTSDALAFRTLQHAADVVKAGDTVHVRAGTYVGMNLFGLAGGTASAPIQFLADPGTVVTTISFENINADLADINIENTGGWYVIQGFDIESDGLARRAGIRVTGSNNCQVLNNTVNQAYIGIFTSNSDNLLVQGNTCKNSIDQHGIYMSLNEHNCVVRGNTLFGNNWDGLHMNALKGQPNDGALVENNIIYGNNLSGMDLEGVTHATFRNNLVYSNTKHGITLHSADQANTPPTTSDLFENNTVVNNGMFAIQMQSVDTAQTLFNNILYSSSPYYGAIGANGPPSGLVSDYNVVVNNFSTDLGSSQLSLGQWQSATGQDKHSIVASPLQLFVNSTSTPPDFHLRSGSAAIDAGVAFFNGYTPPAVDFSGNLRPQLANYDAGAYEVQGPATVPAAPASLLAAPSTPLSITLTWTDSSNNETAFLIERSLDGVNFVPVASAGANVTQYTDAGRTTGVQYTYRVRASNALGVSAYTNVSSAVGPEPPPAPPAPLTLSGSPGTYGIVNLSWAEPSNAVLTGFLIERSTDGTNFTQVATVGSTVTAYTDRSLLPATQYTYRVRATNYMSASGYSPTASATTVPVGPGPYSVWSPSDAPFNPSDADSRAVEVGMKFRSDAAGVITGIRFYKSEENIGPHIADLWTVTGTLLASASLTGETASGWQQVDFTTPVQISANTTYVVSYHTNVGHYADDIQDFTTPPNEGPLRVLADGAEGPNGVYTYSSGPAFPTTAYTASNYWVDVVFATVMPVVDAGFDGTAVPGVPFARRGSFVDTGPGPWTAQVDYGDGAGPSPLTLNADKSFSLNHSYAAIGTYPVSITVTSQQAIVATASFRISVNDTFRVVSSTVTASGVDIRFNRPLDPSPLGLWASDPSVTPDLTLVGQQTGPVKGSLVWDPATGTVHFIKTGGTRLNTSGQLTTGTLAPDTYTLTLAGDPTYSDWLSTAGEPLDGDRDGTPGGAYVSTYTVSPSSAPILSLPDFTRGPGQPLNVNLDGTAVGATGIPVTINDGSGITSASFELDYNPALLSVSSVAAAQAGWVAAFTNDAVNGRLIINASGPALPSGLQKLIVLTANVPSGSSYGSSSVLRFVNIQMNGGAIPAIGDWAVQQDSYLGDVTGDGTYSALDAALISRVADGFDRGFDAARLTDPALIADLFGTGVVSSNDALCVAEQSAGLPQQQIPGPIVNASINPEATGTLVTMPTHVPIVPGGTAKIPLSITANPAGILKAVDLTLSYDPSLVSISASDVSVASPGDGWQFALNASNGVLRIALYNSWPLWDGSATLLNLAVHALPSAGVGTAPVLHIVNSGPTATRLNEGNLPYRTQDGSFAVGTPQVIGRWIFYNNSKFDNNDPGAGPSDDGAIATDKSALLPGHNASFANYTSYAKGMNGIMIDMVGLPSGSLSAADFGFAVGNDSNPSGWPAGPTPVPPIAIRRGAGLYGSDRVELIWPDYNPAAGSSTQAVAGKWLQITVRANTDTGLAKPDVFYFGNAIGDSGNSPTDAVVTVADVLAARGRISSSPVEVTSPWDYDRDGFITNGDVVIARNNQTAGSAALQLISAPMLPMTPIAKAANIASSSLSFTLTTSPVVAKKPTVLSSLVKTTALPPSPSSGSKPAERSPERRPGKLSAPKHAARGKPLRASLPRLISRLIQLQAAGR